MALLQEKDRTALAEMGNQLTNDVNLTVYSQRTSPLIVPGVVPCETCEHAEQLASELAQAMPSVKSEVVDFVEQRERAAQDGVDRIPTMLVGGTAQGRVRFVGFPGGYEAASLVGAIMHAGGAADGLPQDLAATLASVDEPVDLKVFVTPT